MHKENFSLVYFISRPFFLGLIYSSIISQSHNDALISCLLGTLIGCFIIFIFNKADTENNFYRIIKIILYLLFISLGSFVLEIFINDFFLIQTPKIAIIIPSVILCLYASFKDIKTLKYTSFLLFLLSLFFFIITCFFLTNIFDYTNFFPLFTEKTTNIFHSALFYGVLSAMPNILLKEENIPLKKHIIYYLFTSILMFILCLFIIGTLTSRVTEIYRFPEYIILKRIRIFNSIENVENILSSIWYLDYFIFLSLTFKRLYKEVKENKYIFYFLIISIIYITSVILAGSYFPVLILYHYIDYIFGAFIIIFSFGAIKKLFISSERHK